MAVATTAKRMTQTEIISQLADKTGMKKTDAKEFFSALAALATSEVKKNGEFTLPGFGKLVKATRKAREGRNPATGDTIKIPAKTTVKFRLGKAMKDAVGSKQFLLSISKDRLIQFESDGLFYLTERRLRKKSQLEKKMVTRDEFFVNIFS